MDLTIERLPDRLCARITGQLDASAKATFTSADWGDPSATDLILDLSALDFLNSTGLGALLQVVRRFKEAKRGVVCVCPQPVIYRVLEVAGLHRLLPIVASLEEAAKILAERGPNAQG